MKSLSVFSMCLNEIHFIELYLRSNLRFADEVVIVDGGSTDGTVDILADYAARYPGRVIYEVIPQVGRPYSRDWDTGFRRQRCLDRCHSDFAMRLDVDELVSDKFIEQIPVLLDDAGNEYSLSFNFVNFWRDWHTVRINHPTNNGQGGWEGLRTLIWPNTGKVSYPDNYHHSPEYGLWNYKYGSCADIDVYHLHYASKVFLKPNDNRRGDLHCYDNDFSNPDWEGAQLTAYQIALREFAGEYPAILKESGLIEV